MRIEVYDSTLRDGAQAEGISYSLEDKLLIARRLDALGVDYIEGGWPSESQLPLINWSRGPSAISAATAPPA